VLQRFLVRRVVDAPELSSLLLTFGISIALVNLARRHLRPARGGVPDHRRGRPLRCQAGCARFAIAIKAPSVPQPPRQGDPRGVPEPRGRPGVRHRRAAHPPDHLRARLGARRRGRLAGRGHGGDPARDGPGLHLQVVPGHRAGRRRQLPGRAAGRPAPGARGAARVALPHPQVNGAVAYVLLVVVLRSADRPAEGRV
jgi:hypothetical protein